MGQCRELVERVHLTQFPGATAKMPHLRLIYPRNDHVVTIVGLLKEGVNTLIRDQQIRTDVFMTDHFAYLDLTHLRAQ